MVLIFYEFKPTQETLNSKVKISIKKKYASCQRLVLGLESQTRVSLSKKLESKSEFDSVKFIQKKNLNYSDGTQLFLHF